MISKKITIFIALLLIVNISCVRRAKIKFTGIDQINKIPNHKQFSKNYDQESIEILNRYYQEGFFIIQFFSKVNFSKFIEKNEEIFLKYCFHPCSDRRLENCPIGPFFPIHIENDKKRYFYIAYIPKKLYKDHIQNVNTQEYDLCIRIFGHAPFGTRWYSNPIKIFPTKEHQRKFR